MPVRTEEWSFEALRRIRWPEGTVCPRCRGQKVTLHTNVAQSPRRRYLCLECRRTFTDLTGTPFARTNLPLATWFDCLRLIFRTPTHPLPLQGGGVRRVKTSDLARTLKVKWETADRMRRCLLRASLQPGLIHSLAELLAAETAGGHDRWQRGRS